MALGGGTFTTQNKILPGAYINFISTKNSSVTVGERGVCAAPLTLDWGDEGVIEVTAEDFEKNSLKIFGYSYTADKMKPYRELFKNASKCYFYKLYGGDKASSTIATARCSGNRGNSIFYTIEQNVDDESYYDVCTYIQDTAADGSVSNTLVDKQTVTGTTTNLEDNDFITWVDEQAFTETAGTFLTGGASTLSDLGQIYQDFLSAIEGYQFNVLICDNTEDTVKALFASFTKRLRDDRGIKFQTVVYNYDADYEGIINLTTAASESNTALIWWVAGAEAACEVNKSCTNKKYDGEYTPICNETQLQLEAAINNGELKLHRVGSDYRILDDINSLVTTTEEKGSVFKSNQTMRVCDQLAIDIASLFANNYLGKVPNDKSGRFSLRNDIIKYCNELNDLRAIEDFTDDNCTVEAGEEKNAVAVYLTIVPVNAMTKLYMKVYVE